MPKTDYATLADAIASDIAAGRLQPGTRLPPQRMFAYERGIAVSTAGRVYAELLRRGLTVGEVGRGTFVAGRPSQRVPHGMPLDGQIDLEFNYPTVSGQADFIAEALSGLQRPDAAGAATGPITTRQLENARAVFARCLGAGRWHVQDDALLFAGSGRQAIAAALAAQVPVGGRVAAEALSYPMVRNIAARIGASIVPIAMDEEGLLPDALVRAHRKAPVAAMYVQPILHNPLGITMTPKRREDIVRAASQIGVTIIEDFVYGFLGDVAPLASIAPERCIVVDSLSKRIAPGVSVGILHVPGVLRDRLWSQIRSGAWTAPPLALNIAVRMAQSNAMDEIVRLKRRDAVERQNIARKALAAFEVAGDPGCYHLWLKLPGGWRSEEFAASAARIGVAVTASDAFAMAPGHAPPAIRLALGLPSHEELQIATCRLAGLLRQAPGNIDVTE